MFKLNHRIIRADEILEITWDCVDSDRQELVIQTGTKQSVLPVELYGSKKIRLKNHQDKTVIMLRTYKDGKMKTDSKRVWVRPAKQHLDEFEYVDNDNFLVRKCKEFVKDIRLAWNMFSPDRKQLYIVWLMLMVYLVILPFHATASIFVMYAIVCYLFWALFFRK